MDNNLRISAVRKKWAFCAPWALALLVTWGALACDSAKPSGGEASPQPQVGQNDMAPAQNEAPIDTLRRYFALVAQGGGPQAWAMLCSEDKAKFISAACRSGEVTPQEMTEIMSSECPEAYQVWAPMCQQAASYKDAHMEVDGVEGDETVILVQAGTKPSRWGVINENGTNRISMPEN